MTVRRVTTLFGGPLAEMLSITPQARMVLFAQFDCNLTSLFVAQLRRKSSSWLSHQARVVAHFNPSMNARIRFGATITRKAPKTYPGGGLQCIQLLVNLVALQLCSSVACVLRHIIIISLITLSLSNGVSYVAGSVVVCCSLINNLYVSLSPSLSLSLSLNQPLSLLSLCCVSGLFERVPRQRARATERQRKAQRSRKIE